MVTEISPAATSQIVGDERGGKKCGKGKESAKLPTEPGASSHEGEGVGCMLDSFGRVGLVSWRVVHFVLRGVLPPDTSMECSRMGSPLDYPDPKTCRLFSSKVHPHILFLGERGGLSKISRKCVPQSDCCPSCLFAMENS